MDKSGRYDEQIVTEITEATAFYKAEDYHQDYYKKSPLQYKAYRRGSGRDKFLERIWGKEMKTEHGSRNTKILVNPLKTELMKKLNSFTISGNSGKWNGKAI